MLVLQVRKHLAICVMLLKPLRCRTRRNKDGMGWQGWAKQQENNLRASKQYLKSDFKVGVTRARKIPLYLSMSLAPNLCLVRSICRPRSHTPSFPR